MIVDILRSGHRIFFALAWAALSILPAAVCFSQSGREAIYTDFVLYQKRVMLAKDLRERVIGKTFAMPLDSNSEYRYGLACDAISQFLFFSPEVAEGFSKLFSGYDALPYDTKRSFLEAVYAVGTTNYRALVQGILEKEEDARLFTLSAVYLYRCDSSIENANALKIRMAEKFPGYDTLPVLKELETYLSYHAVYAGGTTPSIPQLFAYRRLSGQKTIYSFQRWNRDYPGLALVQNADGSFVRDGQGRLQLFTQLARSGSDLPYFIRDGSTPQGVYCIRGTGVSRTHFIGPTPNLQMIMPNEDKTEKYFLMDSAGDLRAGDRETGDHGAGMSARPDSLRLYKDLWPQEWRDYAPVMEAWNAGRIGRTEIIAHGTTIDPEYFKGQPFYPLTPTMGCLCAKELWNPTTGHLLVSEQFNLVSAWQSTPGNKGYLYVINVDDQHKPVSREEIEAWVRSVYKPNL